MPRKRNKPRKHASRFDRLRERIGTLSVRKRYGLVFVAGLFSVLALPPFYVFPVLLIAFPLLLEVIRMAETPKQASCTGWWFGFGHFVAGLYWISNSLLVDAVRFAWLIPFAVSLIPAVLAVYTAIFAAILHRLKLSGWRLVTAASCLWVIIEFARAYLFTGFPWNLIGYTWVVSDSVMQIASLTGVWGLSLLAMLFALSPLLLAEKATRRFGFMLLLLPLLVMAGGALRLSHAPQEMSETSVRIVQANIKQEMKWEDSYRFKTFMQHVMSSAEKNKPAADIIVWPETAVPFVLEREKFIRDIIMKMIPKDSVVVTGALRVEGEERDYRIWNSLYAASAQGKILGFYDKVRLVPFGEYVPFRAFLPFVEKITYGSTDFSSGPAAKSIAIEGKGTFSPIICYEVIYPDGIVDQKNRPDWIVNVTNDAWFGNSTGPYQHFAMSRMRAVEQGLPLVRAANTGISGLFDAYGRVMAQIPLNQIGTIQMTLPKPVAPTLYAKLGSVPVMLLIGLLFGASAASLARRKSR